jgi:glutaconyl-CoA/methylmalonyl-CoA decarboxylase subunit delta
MNNLGWGLQITVIGMGLVFLLLTILWGLLVLVMRFDRPEEKAAEAPGADEAPVALAADGGGVEVRADGMASDLVAAILVATLAHKTLRRGEAAPVWRSYWPGSLLYASRWIASGRMRQNNSWQRGRR